jgi:hypothetical protein
MRGADCYLTRLLVALSLPETNGRESRQFLQGRRRTPWVSGRPTAEAGEGAEHDGGDATYEVKEMACGATVVGVVRRDLERRGWSYIDCGGADGPLAASEFPLRARTVTGGTIS